MADGTHHGSLNDAAPAQGAALTPGQDLPGDFAALDLEQLLGLDVIVRAPSAAGSSLPGEEDTPADLLDLDLDQLMGLDVTSDAPLPRPNADTFNPLPPTTAAEDAPNDGENRQEPQGEEPSLDLVGLDLETLMEIVVSGIGAIEDIANNGDASLDGGDTLSITGVTQGTNGTVVDNGDGTVTYTPNLSFHRHRQLHLHRLRRQRRQRYSHGQRHRGYRHHGHFGRRYAERHQRRRHHVRPGRKR